MQNLHLAGVTNDRRSLILTSRQGASSGSYLLELDDHLIGLVNRLASRTQPMTATSPRPEEPEPDRARAQLRSRLSPREIQARLRAGFSLDEVAAEAGVEESWVERFATPVLAEREQVISRARRLVFARPKAGPSAMDLGDSVRTKLEARGIPFLDDVLEAGWSAQHIESGRWIVNLAFEERGKAQLAQWEVDFSDGSVVGLDKASAALAFVSQSEQPKVADEPEPEPERTSRPRATGTLTASKAGAGGSRPPATRTGSSSAIQGQTPGSGSGRSAAAPPARPGRGLRPTSGSSGVAAAPEPAAPPAPARQRVSAPSTASAPSTPARPIAAPGPAGSRRSRPPIPRPVLAPSPGPTPGPKMVGSTGSRVVPAIPAPADPSPQRLRSSKSRGAGLVESLDPAPGRSEPPARPSLRLDPRPAVPAGLAGGGQPPSTSSPAVPTTATAPSSATPPPATAPSSATPPRPRRDRPLVAPGRRRPVAAPGSDPSAPASASPNTARHEQLFEPTSEPDATEGDSSSNGAGQSIHRVDRLAP